MGLRNRKMIAALLKFFIFLYFFSDVVFAMEPVTISIDTASKTRIVEENFIGAGVEYEEVGIREVIKNPGGLSALKNLGLTGLRWPNGTSAQFYLWDRPAESYQRLKQSRRDWVLLTADVQALADVLGAELLVQTNTFRFVKNNKVLRLNLDNYNDGAEYAAQWIKYSLSQGYKIENWEIGNEDWIYWSGSEYGRIVQAYAKAMKAVDPNIKIAINGLTGEWKDKNASSWMPELLRSIDEKLIHAISIHAYLSGLLPGKELSFDEQLSNLFAQVATTPGFLLELTEILRQQNSPLKIWVTEFNILQRDPERPSLGPDGVQKMQNVGHALVLADWIGQMMTNGVSKTYYLTLLGHPVFSLIDASKKGTPSKPLEMVPAMVLQMYAKNFGDTILKVDIGGNPKRLTGTYIDKVRQVDLEGTEVTKAYPAVGVYSARDSKRKRVNIILINRDLVNNIPVNVNISRRKSKTRASLMTLGGSNRTTDTNIERDAAVKWQKKEIVLSEPLLLPPHSINHISFDD